MVVPGQAGGTEEHTVWETRVKWQRLCTTKSDATFLAEHAETSMSILCLMRLVNRSSAAKKLVKSKVSLVDAYIGMKTAKIAQ